MFKLKYIIVIKIIFALIICENEICNAQISDELKKKQDEIENTRILLEKNQKKSQNTISGIKLIKKDIRESTKFIKMLNSEMSKIDSNIDNNQKIISNLEKKIFNLKKEYTQVILYVYKTKNYRNKMVYLFASDDFNQAYKRLKYITYYTEFVKDISDKLSVSIDSINKINLKLGHQKETKVQLFDKKENEIKRLKKQQKKQKIKVEKLKSQKQLLLAEYNEKKIAADKLRNIITSQILNSKNNEKKQNNINKKSNEITQKEIVKKTSKKEIKKNVPIKDEVLTEQFDKLKGKLIFPIKGIISDHFGEHKHEILENVIVHNDGIDISPSSNSTDVVAVFAGKISKIFFVPGANTALIIKHGNYFTVYSNLSSVMVKVDEYVTKGQKIGKLSSNSDAVLKFQIWKDKEKLNPSDWLKK